MRCLASRNRASLFPILPKSLLSWSTQISHLLDSAAKVPHDSNLQPLGESYPAYVSSAQAMPVSMRGSAFVSFKHETKEEFEQRRAIEKEFLFTNENHDKLVTRGLSDRCAELELERRSHLNFSSPMSQRSTPSSSPAPVVRSRRPSYETTSPIAHRPAPSPSDSTRRHSYETTSPLALRPPRSASDASSSSSDSSIPSTSSSTPASTFRKGVPEWSVRAA